MKDIIKLDFGVETICEIERETLFSRVENSFYKLLWFIELDSYNKIEQYYLLRYELANHLKSHIVSKKEDSTFIIYSGEEIVFFGNIDTLEINLKVHSSKTIFNISANNEMMNILLSDVNILSTLRDDITSKTKNKVLSNLINDRSLGDEIIYKLSSKDLEIIKFDTTISKDRSCYGLTDIYKILLNENLDNTEGLKFYLLQNFEYIYNTDSCNCGNEGCFFEILKENQLYFFSNNYLDNEGEINSDKVEDDFDRIWSTLSKREKASLLFLYNEFQNSTLLNLAFVKPKFNLMNYQFLMCNPYQPESEDEQFISEVSTLSNFFIQLEN